MHHPHMLQKQHKWLVYDPVDGTGKQLHLINDAKGGGIQNTKIISEGCFSVDGYVEEFNPKEPDHTQLAAELLMCSYGPHFFHQEEIIPLDQPDQKITRNHRNTTRPYSKKGKSTDLTGGSQPNSPTPRLFITQKVGNKMKRQNTPRVHPS